MFTVGAWASFTFASGVPLSIAAPLGESANGMLEIVPLDDQLVLEARVAPKDIAFIRPDQSATVKFTAYDFSIYGGLEAKVENISPDTVVDEKGNAFYLVRVRTAKAGFNVVIFKQAKWAVTGVRIRPAAPQVAVEH